MRNSLFEKVRSKGNTTYNVALAFLSLYWDSNNHVTMKGVGFKISAGVILRITKKIQKQKTQGSRAWCIT